MKTKRKRIIRKSSLSKYFNDYPEKPSVYLVYCVGLEDEDKIRVFATKELALKYLKKRGAKKSDNWWLIPRGDGFNIPFIVEYKKVRGK